MIPVLTEKNEENNLHLLFFAIHLFSNPFTFERRLNALLNLVKMLKGGAAASFFLFSFLSFDLGKYIVRSTITVYILEQ